MAYTDIDNPTDFFRIKLYNGNNNPQNIAWDETDTNMAPDWLWIKSRTGNTVFSHVLGDSVRGGGKYLVSDTTAAEVSNNNVIKTFNTNGFSVGGATFVSEGSRTYVAWGWKETATAGFDIVSYTGNATGGRTIAHSLSAVPKMMIVKNRDAAVKWAVYHHKNTAAPGTDHLKLDVNDATADDDSTWNDTVPTSSVFSVGGSTSTNGDGTAYIAYLFAEKKGYSKFGSYVGNASSNGTFVYTGFKPAFVIFKKSAGTGSWAIQDNKRTPFNEGNKALFADTNAVESTSDNSMDFVSNGFKIRTDTANYNTSGDLYIYMAFAENPLVTSTGIPATAR